MTQDILKARTKKFAIDVIKFVKAVPSQREGDHILKQVLRCSSSVGANYRAACRAKSNADFKYKIEIVEEEADESLFWFELMEATITVNKEELNRLSKEADELTAIFASIVKTMKQRYGKTKK